MVMGNYDLLVDKIAKQSGVDRGEIERKIEGKRAKLSGLISKEGAAQIIAAELGVSFENQRSTINEIMSGMKKVRIVGKIIQIFPVREFNKNGKSGKVCNLIVADETGNTKVVLWDTNHISLIEQERFHVGDVIEVFNASAREGEVHLNSFSEIKPSDETIDKVVMEKKILDKKLIECRIGDRVQSRSFIVQIFDPTSFHVCPQCKKRATFENGVGKCVEHGDVEAEQRALVNLVLDDGSDNLRAVVFHDKLSELGVTFPLQPEDFASIKKDLLGKEMIFQGDVRSNKLFQTPEFIIQQIQPVQTDILIQSLGK